MSAAPVQTKKPCESRRATEQISPCQNPFLCISRYHELCKKKKRKEEKKRKIEASCNRETESYIRRSSVLQKGDILNSFISVSGSASTAPSM